MSFIVEDDGGSFERCPAGMHLARCYRIVDIGTQESTYMGQKKFLHKISLFWEVHGTDEAGKPLLMQDGRPFSIFKNYTLSWSEKSNLRIDLQSWRGKQFTQEEMRKFDLANILGAWCMLNVIDKPASDNPNKIYSNVGSISPVPSIYKQNGLPKEVNPKEIFNLQKPDMKLFESFSENLKKKIRMSPEWSRIIEHDEYAKDQSDSANSKKVFEDVDNIPF